MKKSKMFWIYNRDSRLLVEIVAIFIFMLGLLGLLYMKNLQHDLSLCTGFVCILSFIVILVFIFFIDIINSFKSINRKFQITVKDSPISIKYSVKLGGKDG